MADGERKDPSTTLTGVPTVQQPDGVVELVQKIEPVPLVQAKPAEEIKGPEKSEFHVEYSEFQQKKEELEKAGYHYMSKHSRDKESYEMLLKSRAEKIRPLRDIPPEELKREEMEILSEANRIEERGFTSKIEEEVWKYEQQGCDVVMITTDHPREREFNAVHLFYRKPGE